MKCVGLLFDYRVSLVCGLLVGDRMVDAEHQKLLCVFGFMVCVKLLAY